MKNQKYEQKPWMPYNQVVRLNFDDVEVIEDYGTEIATVDIESRLDDAMIIADSEIARMIKRSQQNDRR